MTEYGRTVVVTGAASGIGAATADHLRSAGCRVIGVDLHDTDVCADLSTETGRTSLVAAVADISGGRVDGVVAAAGTNRQGPLDISVNYFGAVATLTGLRAMLESSTAPRAVAVASFAILEPGVDELVEACLRGDEQGALAVRLDDPSGMDAYASAKRALARWIRRQAITEEWAGRGIALNAIAPGVVRTPMTADLLADDVTADLLLGIVPMPFGGIAEAADVAALIAFLVGPSAKAITGQTFFIDGGADCVRRGDDVFARYAP